jgi:hypothetical protein
LRSYKAFISCSTPVHLIKTETKKKKTTISVGSPATPATMVILLPISPRALAEVAAIPEKAEVAEEAAPAKGTTTTTVAVAVLLANPRSLATLAAVAAMTGNQRWLAMPTAAEAALIANNPRSSVMPAALVGLRRPVTPALAEATAVANLEKLTMTLNAMDAHWWSCCPCVPTLGS